jgi:hypothetical protein
MPSDSLEGLRCKIAVSQDALKLAVSRLDTREIVESVLALQMAVCALCAVLSVPSDARGENG